MVVGRAGAPPGEAAEDARTHLGHIGDSVQSEK